MGRVSHRRVAAARGRPPRGRGPAHAPPSRGTYSTTVGDGGSGPVVTELERVGIEGTIGEQDCPDCGAQISYDRAFVPWCQACRWNVDAGLRPTAPPSRIDQMWKSIADRAGDSLYRQLLASPIVRPRFTISRLAAYAISLPVYAVSIAIFLSGLWLIAFAGNLILRGIGVGVAALGFISRPRFVKQSEPPLLGPRRRSSTALSMSLPELFTPLVSTRSGSPPDWNAATGRFGLRRKYWSQRGWSAALGEPRR